MATVAAAAPKPLSFDLCELVRTCKADEVKRALVAEPALAHRRDEGGRLLLHWAASGGCEPIFRYLLSVHPDQVDEPDESGWTPLMIATSAGHAPIARLSVELGADVSHANGTGQRPLHYAASKDRTEVARLLVDAGASPTDGDKYGATPLHRAASKGNVRVLRIMLDKRNLHVDAADSELNTPLHAACEEDERDAAVVLARAGARFDLANRDGRTPLQLAAEPLRKQLGRLAVEMG